MRSRRTCCARPARSLPIFGDMPEVLVTMAMVGFVESACLKCVSGDPDPGEHSLCVAVDVSHVAPTPSAWRFAPSSNRRCRGPSGQFAVRVFDDGGPTAKAGTSAP